MWPKCTELCGRLGLIANCRSLNVYKYIDENLDTFLLDMSEQKASPREVLSTFLSKICSERDHNKAVMQLQRASLPNDASFDNFDFSASQTNEMLLRELSEYRWVVGKSQEYRFSRRSWSWKNSSGMCIRQRSL